MAYGAGNLARERKSTPALARPVSIAPFQKRPARPQFPEIDCLRDHLPPDVVAAVERRAAEAGVGADRVLVAWGIVDDDSYIRILAHWLGLRYESFEQVTRRDCPLRDEHMLDAAKSGLIPLTQDGHLVLVLAPRSVRQFVDYMAAHPNVQFRLTCATSLNSFVMRACGKAWAEWSAQALYMQRPKLSAAYPCRPLCYGLAALVVMLLGAQLILPQEMQEWAAAILTAGFFIWLTLRIVCSCVTGAEPKPADILDRDLPTYTIIAPLHREAEAIEGLVESLQRLDYPTEKLDIKLVIEGDDLETWAALSRLRLGFPFEIITASQEGPRTKPKALNAALPFARGTFTVIYDAEDRPEPDQLRQAVQAFLRGGNDLACVQARLTIDNTADGWLARVFTAEYAAQFDLFLPGLAAMRLPLPLGGSSNHFRTDVLRGVGAWDAYNVTEDADLGMRLSRFRYRTAVINSATYEEAPTGVRSWMRQRTRWFKGWMQTWLVHMRTPVRLFRELGFWGFVTFQLVVGGNVLAALIHPYIVLCAVIALATGRPVAGTNGAPPALAYLFLTSMAAGYVVSFLLGLRGLAHRGLLSSAPALILIPVHWLLLSWAAWRAVIKLWRDPHGWEKTEHGQAKTSRLADSMHARASEPRFAQSVDNLAPSARRAA